jgi:O-antigen/teichoic acid export membrane protein
MRVLSHLRSAGVVSNTLASVLLRGSITAIQLGVVLLPTFFVEISIFGSLAFLIAMIELFKIFAEFGIDTYATREFARNTQQTDIAALSSRVLWLKLAMGGLSYLALLGFYWLTQPPSDVILVVIGGLLIFTGLWIGLPLSYFQAKLLTRVIALPITAVNIAMLIVTTVLLMWQPLPIVAVVCLLVSEIVAGALLWRAFRRTTTFLPSQIQVNAKPILRASLPIGITTSIIALYGQFGAIVLNTWFGTVATGSFLFAERLTQPPLLIAGAYAYSVFSRLSTMHAYADAATLQKKAWQYVWGAFLFGALCAILVSQLGRLLVPIVLSNYVAAVPVLQIMSVVLGLRVINSCLTRVIHAYGHFDWTMWVAIANLIAVVIFTPIGIYIASGIGAAAALVFSEGFNLCVQLWLVRKKKNAI